MSPSSHLMAGYVFSDKNLGLQFVVCSALRHADFVMLRSSGAAGVQHSRQRSQPAKHAKDRRSCESEAVGVLLSEKMACIRVLSRGTQGWIG
jgi:hypothetical protein